MLTPPPTVIFAETELPGLPDCNRPRMYRVWVPQFVLDAVVITTQFPADIGPTVGCDKLPPPHPENATRQVAVIAIAIDRLIGSSSSQSRNHALLREVSAAE